MQYSNTYHKPSKFDPLQHNSDGTMTTIVTTCACINCGHTSIHMEQTPVDITLSKHLTAHDSQCNNCAWANSGEYI